MSLFDVLDGEDSQTQANIPERSWMSRMTSVPDSDRQGQWSALSMPLLQAGVAISNANRPGVYGARPNAAYLLTQGVSAFGQGLGAQALLRQRAMAEEAKARLGQVRMARELAALEWEMQRRQALGETPPGMGMSEGGDFGQRTGRPPLSAFFR